VQVRVRDDPYLADIWGRRVRRPDQVVAHELEFPTVPRRAHQLEGQEDADGQMFVLIQGPGL
jgi:hypothetical protein